MRECGTTSEPSGTTSEPSGTACQERASGCRLLPTVSAGPRRASSIFSPYRLCTHKSLPKLITERPCMAPSPSCLRHLLPNTRAGDSRFLSSDSLAISCYTFFWTFLGRVYSQCTKYHGIQLKKQYGNERSSFS